MASNGTNGSGNGGIAPWLELIVKVGAGNAIGVYVVYWLTTSFSAKIDHLTASMNELIRVMERLPR
ncbi:MAG TPA: hypothetical protein VD948_08715 [Rhodothermales bacterium]|nr:hypothetical protein [Rhodothermales bacterium]